MQVTSSGRVSSIQRLGTRHLCRWVSTSHPGQLPCQLDGAFHHGADGVAWMVRFPRVGRFCDDYTDEKVAMEVTALNLIHNRTTIPVPKVHAWGPATSNPLGLGPFIIMDFIDGVSLSDFLRAPNAERPTRHSAEWRGDRTQGFATTTEYFHYVADQDLGQLIHQPNSTVGSYDAKNKYVAFKVLRALIPDLLICDDLGLANLIVRDREDLTVVGVGDLEWSYVGPAQLFGSAPWWRLQDRPVNSSWDFTGDEPPEIAARYFRCLDIFIDVLEEEEAKMPGHDERELSSLVKWSRVSGAMWLHMLLSPGFNDHRSLALTQRRRHLGPAE
ncbi:hypothetical protein BO82DRAFT_385341 [Aspergillus uvarum CBS 121591]|uniref:Aminoglycoside phosphotransferase domain-containing protein n=1 Tax=Aspergillus uvarum CBS 121591 TaxID=1448315 RepID=A0A319CKC5_9EURO|nr:hypothetical protein BO82DRAFT_385341 [Aspergillus uvarum CBS 121591]PYH79103.1 hypothetical protein BO82DRAFT_385341 [Aspergillus uvarum CBS 121591]